MKRFYCTVCQKIKRVRNIPNNVKNPDAYVPEDRIGECDRHVTVSYHYRPGSIKAKVGA